MQWLSRETPMTIPFTKKFFLSPFARRFVAGETLEEALEVLKNLKGEGFLTTLDFLGESVQNQQEALQATQEYIANLKFLRGHEIDKNISVKLTQLGLDMDEDFALGNLARVVEVAGQMGGFVRVDMESSHYTESTLRIVRNVHQQFPFVGAVLQAMLRRTSEDALALLKERVRIRLCKGAYKEPPSISFPNKKDVDQQYVTVMKRLLTSGIYHGIATHDEKIVEEAKQFALHEKLAKDSFEFQMLFGIRRGLAKRLVDEGWRVRIYVPYGKFWFPYMMRRLRERKENIWFVVKNLFRD